MDCLYFTRLGRPSLWGPPIGGRDDGLWGSGADWLARYRFELTIDLSEGYWRPGQPAPDMDLPSVGRPPDPPRRRGVNETTISEPGGYP